MNTVTVTTYYTEHILCSTEQPQSRAQYSHNHKITHTAPVQHRNHTYLLPQYSTHTTSTPTNKHSWKLLRRIQHRNTEVILVMCCEYSEMTASLNDSENISH